MALPSEWQSLLSQYNSDPDKYDLYMTCRIYSPTGDGTYQEEDLKVDVKMTVSNSGENVTILSALRLFAGFSIVGGGGYGLDPVSDSINTTQLFIYGFSGMIMNNSGSSMLMFAGYRTGFPKDSYTNDLSKLQLIPTGNTVSVIDMDDDSLTGESGTSTSLYSSSWDAVTMAFSLGWPVLIKKDNLLHQAKVTKLSDESYIVNSFEPFLYDPLGNEGNFFYCYIAFTKSSSSATWSCRYINAVDTLPLWGTYSPMNTNSSTESELAANKVNSRSLGSANLAFTLDKSSEFYRGPGQSNEWVLILSVASSGTLGNLAFSFNVKWANGNIPTFEAGDILEIHFLEWSPTHHESYPILGTWTKYV